MTIRVLLIVAFVSTMAACFNDNSPQNNDIVADNRFEVATASVILGARQLLVDTSNGDVWMLEGDRSPQAHWVLLSRGPDDVRTPEPVEIPHHTQPLPELEEDD